MADTIIGIMHSAAKEHEQCFAIFSAPSHAYEWHDDVEEAQDRAIALSDAGQDVYYGVGWVTTPPAKGRGRASDVTGIPGLWIDIDAGERDSGRRYPATIDEAMDLAHAISEPTAIVHSGRGIHAYWMFPAPWIFGDEGRAEAAAMARAWQEAHAVIARDRGLEIDMTSDLARVLRVDGTKNRKVDVVVAVVDGPWPFSLTREDARRLAGASHGPEPATIIAGPPDAGMVVRGIGTEPIEIRGARDTAEDWALAVSCLPKIPAATWQSYESWLRIGMALHSIDPSAVGMSVWDHFSRQAPNYAPGICAGKWASFEAGKPGGVGVGSLIHLSGGDIVAHATGEIARERAAGICGPAGDDRDRILGRIEVATGIPIRRWIRRGAELGRVRYFAILRNGLDISIGGGRSVMDYRSFAAAVYEQTDLVLRQMKAAQWSEVASDLARVVEDDTEEEEHTHGRVEETVTSYLRAVAVHDDPSPTQIGALEPFVREGAIHVAKRHLAKWIRADGGDPDGLISDLKRTGWRRITIATGAGSSRSYYWIQPNQEHDFGRTYWGGYCVSRFGSLNG